MNGSLIAGLLIGGGVVGVAMSLLALKINNDWHECCQELNEDWYNLCTEVNKRRLEDLYDMEDLYKRRCNEEEKED